MDPEKKREEKWAFPVNPLQVSRARLSLSLASIRASWACAPARRRVITVILVRIIVNESPFLCVEDLRPLRTRVKRSDQSNPIYNLVSFDQPLVFSYSTALEEGSKRKGRKSCSLRNPFCLTCSVPRVICPHFPRPLWLPSCFCFLCLRTLQPAHSSWSAPLIYFSLSRINAL